VKQMKLLSLLIVALFMMGCNAMDSADPSLNVVGEWRIVHIGERPVIENSPATISFEQDGRFGGNASCNRYFGSYTLEGSSLEIGEHMGATRMMCAEQALMEQEDRLFEILPMAVTVQSEDGQMLLRDKDGKQVLKAARVE
jgi:heat shock protein HslJ